MVPSLTLNPKAVVAGTIGIGHWGKGQVAGVDIGFADDLVQGHVPTGQLQAAGRLQAGDLYTGQGVALGIAEVEVGFREGIDRILQRRNRLINTTRFIFH